MKRKSVMLYVERTAFYLGRKDEVPNRELARELAESDNREGLDEMASYLGDKNKTLASDCLKVLYEASYIKPELIVPYFEILVPLLQSKNNRMVWGAMIGIASIAKVEPIMVYKHIALIRNKIETGSLITNIHGVYAMINMAGADESIYDELIDELLKILEETRPIDVAKRAESLVPIIKATHQARFIEILEKAGSRVSKAGVKRIEKVIKKVKG